MTTLTAPDRRFISSQVALPGGVRLRYVHGGAEQGPVVLMLHGLSDSAFSFSRVLPLIPPRFRVIAVDQRGHGDSSRPDDGYAMDDFAGDLLALMDALGIAQATVVGHSMGSFVARRAAERAPARITRLVLVGTALTARNAGIAALRASIDALRDPVDEAFIREFQGSTIARPVPPDFFDQVIRESRKVPARVWQRALAGLWEFQPQWPIVCPTIILAGDQDAVFDTEEHRALCLGTERCTLHVEPGIGHSLHWEAPERFVALAFGRER